MTDQVIGTARIDIEANASGVEAATDKAKASIASMSKDAQAQYQRLSAAEKRRVDGLIRQADTVGMTRAQQIAYNASLKTSGPLLDDLTRRLKVSETATQKAGAELNKYGLSARQEAAALRQVPAQITDIVTSLQGGQRPMTVLLQQGGQLKDVFGGVVPAANALTGALIGMINPATLAIGALAALAFGYLRGAKEGEEFRKTLVLTNSAIGVSAEELQNMAERLDGVAGTQANASKVLNLFAKDAAVSATSLQQYAQTAIEWERAAGQSVEEVVEQFAALAEEPLKASEKLNESMRYLTASTYEQIKALMDAGQRTDAAALAQSEYDRALRERTPLMVENLGLVERAWKAIKDASAEAMDALFSVGRQQTLAQQLADAQRDYAKNFGEDDDSTAYRGGYGSKARTEARQRIYDLQEQIRLQAAASRRNQEAQRDEQRRTDALIRWGKQSEQIQSNAIKREKEIAQARKDALVLGKSEKELAEQIAAINDKYKDQQGRAYSNDAATRMLMSLREQEASLRAQAEGIEKLTSAQAELVKFEQQIADIKSKQTLTADEKSILAAQDRLRAQYEINVSVEKEAQTKLQQIEVEKQLASLRANQSLNQAQFMRELEEFGRGDSFRALNRELKRIEDQYRRIITAQSAKPGGITQEALTAIQSAMDEDLSRVRQQNEKLLSLQENWLYGASRSLENYADRSRNIAGQTEQAFTNLYDGLTDAASKWAVGMDVSIKDVGQSFAAMIVKMQLQAAAAPLFSGLQSVVSGWLNPSAPAGVTPGLDWTFNAKGNVYDSPSLSRYSNQVHETPQFFAFAKGAGVFAEAGPEAIMPLKRGPDGTLGVRAHGQESGSPQVALNITNNGTPQAVDGQPRVSVDQMGRVVIDIMMNDLRRNGQYARALKGSM